MQNLEYEEIFPLRPINAWVCSCYMNVEASPFVGIFQNAWLYIPVSLWIVRTILGNLGKRRHVVLSCWNKPSLPKSTKPMILSKLSPNCTTLTRLIRLSDSIHVTWTQSTILWNYNQHAWCIVDKWYPWPHGVCITPGSYHQPNRTGTVTHLTALQVTKLPVFN